MTRISLPLPFPISYQANAEAAAERAKDVVAAILAAIRQHSPRAVEIHPRAYACLRRTRMDQDLDECRREEGQRGGHFAWFHGVDVLVSGDVPLSAMVLYVPAKTSRA